MTLLLKPVVICPLRSASTAALDAQASTWCESRVDDVVMTWSFVSVPAASSVTDAVLSDNLSNTALAPEFLPDVVGEYVLSLNISDGQVSSNQDFVVVTSYAGDAPPTADCGGEYSGMIGEVVTLRWNRLCRSRRSTVNL